MILPSETETSLIVHVFTARHIFSSPSTGWVALSQTSWVGGSSSSRGSDSFAIHAVQRISNRLRLHYRAGPQSHIS